MSDSIRCWSCGSTQAADVTFCKKCGARLSTVAVADSTPATPSVRSLRPASLDRMIGLGTEPPPAVVSSSPVVTARIPVQAVAPPEATKRPANSPPLSVPAAELSWRPSEKLMMGIRILGGVLFLIGLGGTIALWNARQSGGSFGARDLTYTPVFLLFGPAILIEPLLMIGVLPVGKRSEYRRFRMMGFAAIALAVGIGIVLQLTVFKDWVPVPLGDGASAASDPINQDAPPSTGN